MRKETAIDFCLKCLEYIISESAGHYIENPAIQFTEDAKAGRYDTFLDEEYQAALDEIDELASLWSGQPRKTAGDILLYILERMPISEEQANLLAGQLSELLVWPNPDGNSVPQAARRPMLESFFAVRTPKAIRDMVSKHVIGQPEAVKAAALVLYHQLSGRRTNAVFAGPSGCGKSEIWRALSKEYPGLIRMVDFSRFSADGWSGSLHLRDIFTGIDPNHIKQCGLVIVLDEADKILCERAVGSGGTDYHAIVQNNLLKMLDGDVIEFGAKDNQPALSIDCSRISVVMLGAFERLLENKVRDNKQIGFGGSDTHAADTETTEKHRNISYADLIGAGMRREIAGRINKIVALDPLSQKDYKSILTGPVLSGIQEATCCKISIDRAAADTLAEQAIASGLGVRWMRSALLGSLDDALFDVPDAKEYRITLREGKLHCQARNLRSSASTAKHPRQSSSRSTDCDLMEDLPF